LDYTPGLESSSSLYPLEQNVPASAPILETNESMPGSDYSPFVVCDKNKKNCKVHQG